MSELEQWCRLELDGYFDTNQAPTDDIVVPEYRAVPGQHVDIYGNVLDVPVEFAFVNEARMRQGVEELQGLAKAQSMLSFHDPHLCKMIKESLGIDVYYFRFHPSSLAGMLAAIRSALRGKLAAIAETDLPAEVSKAEPAGEIIMLRPNFYGIGIDLRALWKRIWGPRQHN